VVSLRAQIGEPVDGQAPSAARLPAPWQAPGRSWLARLGLAPRAVPARGWWAGASGRRYVHLACPLANAPDIGPATYLIVAHQPNGRVSVLYAGEADDLRRRLLDETHLARDAALRAGATHVHVCLAAESEADRCAVVADLVRSLRPPLNAEPADAGIRPAPSGLAPRRLAHS